MKKNSHWECVEVGNKCNSMIRTMGEDWAWWDMQCVLRSLIVDFILFSLFILFYFSFLFHFHFSIFRTTQVRVYQSRCHISHKLMT